MALCFLYQSIKVPYPSYERGRLYKRIFINFINESLFPTAGCGTFCDTVPLSYMIDDRKLFFYRKLSLSKNVILRTLMCLPGVSSDFTFLCSKYGVRSTATRDSI